MTAVRAHSPPQPAAAAAFRARQCWSRFRPILNAHGVTEQQWRIIRVLIDSGPREPREIVTLCGISSPSLAGILARAG